MPVVTEHTAANAIKSHALEADRGHRSGAADLESGPNALPVARKGVWISSIAGVLWRLTSCAVIIEVSMGHAETAALQN